MSTLVRLVLLYCLGATACANAATFTFRFNDAAGEGFNDPAPFTPVGGNTATTLGQARRNMVMEAGRIWGALLVSDVPIVVDVAFDPQTCMANSGTLASAGAFTFFRDFLPPPTSPNTFFASALADSLAGEDLMAQTGSPNNPDIRATFNLAVDSDPACLGGAGFYYGFDHNKGSRIDALIVALHELAHGFGFSSEINLTTGNGFRSNDGVARFSTYVMRIFDESQGRTWPMLTAQERVQSAVRNGFVAWDGDQVKANVGLFRAGVTNQGRLQLFAPATVDDGSSISHWDRAVTPNILMEPNISASLITSTVDVTVCALRDIGWQTTRCPDNAQARGATPQAISQAVTVIEDTATSVALMATDAENDPLSFAISTAPTKGTLSGTGGTRTYTPNLNATGADSFRFTATDGGTTSAPATVTINITPVNDAPIATAQMLNVTTGTLANLTLLGADPDGDTLTFEVLSNPASGTLGGTGAARTYLSNTGFIGTDTFTYRVRDSSTTSTVATVTLNVVAAGSMTPAPTPGNNAPVPSGGGGAMGELLLLALGGLALAARRRRAR